MNEHGYLDYKTAIGAQKDYRTSTYQRHVQFPDQVSPSIHNDFALKNKQCLQSIGDEERFLTESQEQFSCKILNPSTARKPIANGINFIKSLEEISFRNYPNLMPDVSSVSQRDYQWKSKPLEEHTPVIHLVTENEANKVKSIHIDRCKSGFGKLLDPSATTNNLAYRAYSTEESIITSKNIITFWNWKNTFEKEHTFCNITSKRSMRHRESQNSSLKHVPNSGLKTEAKFSYAQHLNLTNFDSSHINNKFINFPYVPNETKSENTIYGSGIRIQKYLA